MNPKVLLVDDSATMRRIIARLFDDAGLPSPTEASDGEEAIVKFKAEKFDLVLTDWNMPNKSGLELVREIRAMGSTVPVIMITTEADKSRIAEALKAGVSDYIVKPFDREKLRAKLEDNMNEQAAPQQAKAGNPTSQWCPEFVCRPTTESWTGGGKPL